MAHGIKTGVWILLCAVSSKPVRAKEFFELFIILNFIFPDSIAKFYLFEKDRLDFLLKICYNMFMSPLSKKSLFWDTDINIEELKESATKGVYLIANRRHEYEIDEE